MSISLPPSAPLLTSGSVRGRNTVGQYRKSDPVQLVADHLRRPASVAAQYLKPSDPRCPFPLAGEISLALYQGGRGDVAEGLRLPIDLARFRMPELSAVDALMRETEVEGEANAAEMAYMGDQSPGATDTTIRRLERHVEILQIAIVALKQSRAKQA